MASKRSGSTLKRSVTVINPDDGQDYTFGPDDELPAWASKLITNPAAYETEEDHVDDEGNPSGAVRDAALNQRGRVLRQAPMVNGPGEKRVPTNSKDTGTTTDE